jgi:photosystem II stability/assembly factor-like uncharacterized protein
MSRPTWLALTMMLLSPCLFAAPVPQHAALDRATAASSAITRPAVQSPQALHAVMQAIARSGERLVAVGERGTVLLSDDNGERWRQVPVPVSSTLTAVQFVAQQGWAVGHAGVVLHTRDGGEHWKLQLDGVQLAELELQAALADGDKHRLAAARQSVADGADKPLLAVSFTDAQQGLIVGAYGMAFATVDGGQHWTSLMGRLPNQQGLHLYGVAQFGAQVYVAGEQGLFLRSLDRGERFEAIDTGYEGSYFGLAVQADGAVVLGGLRGKVMRSSNLGQSFTAVDNPVPVSINDMRVFGRQLILINQAGGLLQGEGDHLRLRPVALPPGPPLTAVAQAADGALVGVGFAGPVRLAMPLNVAE